MNQGMTLMVVLSRRSSGRDFGSTRMYPMRTLCYPLESVYSMITTPAASEETVDARCASPVMRMPNSSMSGFLKKLGSNT